MAWILDNKVHTAGGVNSLFISRRFVLISKYPQKARMSAAAAERSFQKSKLTVNGLACGSFRARSAIVPEPAYSYTCKHPVACINKTFHHPGTHKQRYKEMTGIYSTRLTYFAIGLLIGNEA